MAWTSNLRKGSDLPTWDWLSFFPQGSSYHGTSNVYDGSRYFYWMIQYGSTGAASTTQLWRYCTWTDAWQYLAQTTSGYSGIDLEWDPVRNCLWILSGNTTTEWRVFSLNTSNISVLGQTITPYGLTTITTVLPATASTGAAIQLVEDTTLTEPFDSGVLATGSTTTSLIESGTASFNAGFVGLSVRMTSGAANGQRRYVSAVNATGTTLTLSTALANTPAAGDSFVIEYPQGTATSGSTTTLADTSANWTVNIYSNSDVLITSGTGAGQRRRIASNTATTLTLAAAVTGNTRTGNWTTSPDATSVYKIVPSSDFLYYMPANGSTNFYKIDLNTGATATTWTTLTVIPGTTAGGASLLAPRNAAPFSLLSLRGNGTSTIYRYDIGLNSWATLTTTYFGSETFNTGAHSTMIHGSGRIAIQTVAGNRLIAYRLSDGGVEPLGTQPYAAPASYDGRRMRFVKSADGVLWLYLLRAGGSEFFRLALEWL